MSDIRLVEAPLEIVFEEITHNPEQYEREYARLNDGEDALAQWLRAAKTKGDSNDSDPIVLQLLVDLYRKMERIENLLLKTPSDDVVLANHADIGRIGYEHFELSAPLLQTGIHYYGRLELPVHPKREVSLFFEALSPTLAKVSRIHRRDENDWGTYMMARERTLIRHIKGRE